MPLEMSRHSEQDDDACIPKYELPIGCKIELHDLRGVGYQQPSVAVVVGDSGC